MYFHTKPIKSSTRRGYTLLFSVLTAALVLGVAVFILGVSRKQAILASTALESIYAIYAADSGIECANANWNQSTGTPSYPAPQLSCNGSAISLPAQFVVDQNPPSVFTTTLTINGQTYPFPVYTAGVVDQNGVPINGIPVSFSSSNTGSCALLKFWSGYATDPSAPGQLFPRTIIESRGYNLCSGSGNTLAPSSNPATVERALRLTQ